MGGSYDPPIFLEVIGMKLYDAPICDQFSLGYYDRKTHENLMIALEENLQIFAPCDATVDYADTSYCSNKFYCNTSLDMWIKTDKFHIPYI